jgi:nickel-dependent lactate racemase
MRVEMAFGRTGLEIELPEGFRYRILEARSAAPLADPAEALQRALDQPTGAPPLLELARGKRSAAISVCDITRPAPNSFVLPAVLSRLEAAGIPRSNITILIATGLHRPATAEEIGEIVGPDIAARYRVENHFARRPETHRYLGRTASGTPVYIDERFLDADLHLSLGLIEPHFMLGFSGGRKLVAPGLAAQETIQVLHSPRFIRDPRSAEGLVDGNPLHAELLEIARMARHDFSVEVAINRERRIAAIFAGEPAAAHRAGVEFVSRALLEQIDEPADAAVTSAAGYPLDLTFYQSIKGASAAQHVVKPGGRILLVAACEEGAGAPEFRELLKRFPTAEEYLRQTAEAPVIVDQWQLDKLALVTRRAEVLFYVPGLPREYYPTLWGRAFSSAAEAVAELTRDLKPGATIAVLPEGPYVLARAPAPEAKAA